MNERPQERCRGTRSNLRVPCRLKVTSRNFTIINLESPYSSQDPKKSVRVRTCTGAPIALSKPHIMSVSAHVTTLSTFSSAVPKIYIETRRARAHVHNCIVTPHGRVEAT